MPGGSKALSRRGPVLRPQEDGECDRKLPPFVLDWLAARGWTPRQHQIEVFAKARAGRSVLLIAPTGGGKTLASFLPSLSELAVQAGQGLNTLYVSPLKALAVDVDRNLRAPIGVTVRSRAPNNEVSRIAAVEAPGPWRDCTSSRFT